MPIIKNVYLIIIQSWAYGTFTDDGGPSCQSFQSFRCLFINFPTKGLNAKFFIAELTANKNQLLVFLIDIRFD